MLEFPTHEKWASELVKWRWLHPLASRTGPSRAGQSTSPGLLSWSRKGSIRLPAFFTRCEDMTRGSYSHGAVEFYNVLLPALWITGTWHLSPVTSGGGMCFRVPEECGVRNHSLWSVYISIHREIETWFCSSPKSFDLAHPHLEPNAMN